jgi:hypothetical protein
MRYVEDTMARLWLLKGDPDAPGWQALRSDQQEEKVDIIHLDPHVWAILRSDQQPGGYDGLDAGEPPDGIYLDPNGSPLYLANGEVVAGARDVISALGADAEQLLERIGDPEAVLERLGRAF